MNLSNKVETLQNQNDELTAEVSAATAILIDTQTRMQAEKFKNGNVQTDALFRAQQERYDGFQYIIIFFIRLVQFYTIPL